ncbi:metal ABC transporter ATP-binding protein [Arcanobacterium phocae]|uniref:metal ABC transporter ATP-binding protein n=1 Tax=Arcanobacterium phocae TaxID=131112 RepID=UPI001C0EC3C3|nr:metal ABC transporter ATP-binding protein [Arcanobacterium phocae]
MTTSPAVSVRNLHVTLDGTKILHGIDMDIDAGSTVAILGANGSGKSTLIRALVGVIPHEGTVCLFGHALGRKAPWQRIGYAPQRVSQSSKIPATALETVMSGLIYGWHFKLPKDSKTQALSALATVGLAARAHESVQTFSGGQQQRVLIARALVRNPDLLILDEPFAGIDSQSREHIIEALTILRNQGKTIVMVLHDLYSLDSIIDQTYVVDNGRFDRSSKVPIPSETPSPSICYGEIHA